MAAVPNAVKQVGNTKKDKKASDGGRKGMAAKGTLKKAATKKVRKASQVRVLYLRMRKPVTKDQGVQTNRREIVTARKSVIARKSLGRRAVVQRPRREVGARTTDEERKNLERAIAETARKHFAEKQSAEVKSAPPKRRNNKTPGPRRAAVGRGALPRKTKAEVKHPSKRLRPAKEGKQGSSALSSAKGAPVSSRTRSLNNGSSAFMRR